MNLLEKHFDTAFAAPDGIRKLRELILTLAMQGKLVSQDPDDQPASELLQEIAAEKKRLVKEGKIKAGSREDAKGSKSEEVPYELPKGWEWVRLGSIAFQITDGAHHTPTYVNSGIPFLSVKDMSSGHLSFSDTRYISKEQHENLSKRCHPEKGDLLLTKIGTTGVPVLVETEEEFSIFVSVALIKFSQKDISGRFLSHLVKSPLVKKQSEDGTEGVGNKNLVLRKINNFIIPLPPLAEQHRIVAKIDQLMARCDELEKLRAEREQKRLTVHTAALSRLLEPSSPSLSSSFPRRRESSNTALLDPRLCGGDEVVCGGDEVVCGNNTFPDKAKASKAVIPAGFRPESTVCQCERAGSPTETFGDDKQFSGASDAWHFITQHFGELYSVKENVAELRKAILQLAVMGKLVPQDPHDQPASELLQEIAAEKKRLVKEGKIKAGSREDAKAAKGSKPEEVPYELPNGWEWVRFFTANTVKSELVSAKDYPYEKQIAPDSIEKGSGRLLSHRTVEECGAIGPNNKFYEGQILYSKIRPSLNKAVIAPYAGLCSADMYPIVTHVNAEFMLKVILSETFLTQVRQAENRVKMPKLNLESLGQFIIPLPPLAEQHRIVAKIDQLMALCDAMEQQIDAATGKQTALLNAVMAQV